MTTNHACTGSGSGTVQVELGTIGSTRPRLLNTDSQTLANAYDAGGVLHSDSYRCTTATGYDKLLGNTHTFQYVKVARAASPPSAPTRTARASPSTPGPSATASSAERLADGHARGTGHGGRVLQCTAPAGISTTSTHRRFVDDATR